MDSTERQFVRLTQLVLDGIATDAERAELARLVGGTSRACHRSRRRIDDRRPLEMAKR